MSDIYTRIGKELGIDRKRVMLVADKLGYSGEPSQNILTFDYVNHSGIMATRRVVPDRISFLVNPGFGYQPGWFLVGICLDKNDWRSFALTRIVFPDGNNTFSLNIS